MKVRERCSCGAEVEVDDGGYYIDGKTILASWRKEHLHAENIDAVELTSEPVDCPYRPDAGWRVTVPYWGTGDPPPQSPVTTSVTVEKTEPDTAERDLPPRVKPGEKCCQDNRPGEWGVCLAAVGHDGPHVAYGTPGPRTWPQS